MPLLPPVPSKPDRLPALDQLRGFIVILVVLHHAMLAYCTFGHVDRLHYALSTAPIVDVERWGVFDVAVRLDDGFFMPLLFLLSGLFVRNSVTRKGVWTFLRGRLFRLGLPFAVAELVVVPLAYYPSFLQAGGPPGFPEFWATTVTTGPWPSGPPWFIGILLLFDVAAALTFALSRRPVPKPATLGVPQPVRGFAMLLAVSVLLYLPPLAAFGPARWLSVGPLAIQGSRALLYAAYFAAGVALGMTGAPAIVRWGEALARQWPGWAAVAVLAAATFVAAPPLHAAVTDGPASLLQPGLAGIVLATYCAAACFAMAALFLRFGGRPGPVWTSLAANGFVIYLVHYPIVTWIQYALLPISFSAVGKGLATFTTALAASWSIAALLRLTGVSMR